MKKRMKLFLLLGACMILAVGCQKSEREEGKQEEKKAETLEIDSEEKDEEEEVEEAEEADEPDQEEGSGQQQTPAAETKTVTIYSSNDNADGFVTEDVEASEVTAGWLLGQLASRGTVSGEVQALSCTETQVDGVKALNLDLNQAFGNALGSMGTAGEYMTLGSVVNTFLDAFECEKIQITVEGATLATGHTDYPGYLNRFQ